MGYYDLENRRELSPDQAIAINTALTMSIEKLFCAYSTPEEHGHAIRTLAPSNTGQKIFGIPTLDVELAAREDVHIDMEQDNGWVPIFENRHLKAYYGSDSRMKRLHKKMNGYWVIGSDSKHDLQYKDEVVPPDRLNKNMVVGKNIHALTGEL